MTRKVDEDLYLEEGDEMKFEDHSELDPLEEKRPRGSSKKTLQDDDKEEGVVLEDEEDEEEGF